MKLSSQSISLLEELRKQSPLRVSELEKEGYDQAMVNRAALELEEEGLIQTEDEEEVVQQVTDKGREVIEDGSPEHRLLEELENQPKQMSELKHLDLDVALGKARQKDWVEIDGDAVRITQEGLDALGEDPVQRNLESRNFTEELEDRGLVETRVKKDRLLELTDRGEEVEVDGIEEDFNVEAAAKTPRIGKKHFYRVIRDYARRVWMDLGFEEMSGDYVTSSFLNFDALYTPQDHPAREMHDTFFLETPETADLSGFGEKVDHVGLTHEDGWETGSTGWNYDWSREEAERNVLRTHTTAVSARRLHEIDIDEEELPKKLFVIGRNFRNETVDRTHLPEFFQTDGIVVGRDLSFAHLKGYISEFFEKMGYDEFRLIPSYYPYVEMGVEVQVWDEEDEEWLGMGGAGMFRPEVVKPMLGFEATVLAWGLGIGRIAMIQAELEDIRELYRNDIEILEKTPVWRPDR